MEAARKAETPFTPSAFQVDTSTMEKLLADTENNLKNYSAARRRLAEACRLDQPIYDPLTGEEHTRMQTVAARRRAAARRPELALAA